MVAPNDFPSEAPAEDEIVTPQMEIVIDRRIAGCSIVDAAAAAGVDRTTVHRWIRDHWGFQAALNRRRRELREALQLQRETVAQQAMNNVANAVAAGCVKTSRYVLDRLDLPPAAPPTPALEDPLYLKIMAALRELEDFEAQRRASLTLFNARTDAWLEEYEKTHPGATAIFQKASLRMGLDGTWTKLRKLALDRAIAMRQQARRAPQVENGGAPPESDQAEREAHEDPGENEGDPAGNPETS